MAVAINRRLKAARTLQGLTQAELAGRLSRSQSWLSKLENGRVEPCDLDIALICRVLGLPPADLFPEKAEPAQLKAKGCF